MSIRVVQKENGFYIVDGPNQVIGPFTSDKLAYLYVMEKIYTRKPRKKP